MLQLLISHPTLGEKPFALSQEDLVGEATIGRASRNQVVLDDPGVSRLHARLTMRQGTLFISDAGSTSGTILNGTRLTADVQARLVEGDRLAIGPFTVTVRGADAGGDSLRTTIMAEPPVAAYMPLANVPADGYRLWTGGELLVRLVRVINETQDVRTLVFAGESPTRFCYRPGQSVQVRISLDGVVHQRHFSISSAPSRPHTLSITVRRESGAGTVSAWLHERLLLGDALTIHGPFGDFSCITFPSPRLLLLSGGIGVVPILSMVRWLIDTAPETDVVVVHSARSLATMVGARELELLMAQHPRLRVVVTTTRNDRVQPWLGLSGRLDADMLLRIVPDALRRTVFCCGPDGFRAVMKEALLTRQFPAARFHEERFGTPNGVGTGPVAQPQPATRIDRGSGTRPAL